MSGEIRSGAAVLPPRPKTAKEKAAALAALTEEEKRKTRCCVVSSFPQRIARPIDDVKVDLENEILAAVRDGSTTFVVSLTTITDIWSGTIVLRLKDRFPDLKLIAVVPFPAFRDSWDDGWETYCAKLLAKADWVKVFAREYSPKVFRNCNTWMIDRSARVIAVYDRKSYGTGSAISYARKEKAEVTVIRI